MGFKWSCPICGGFNFYDGSKTTNVVVKCKICGKANVKASSHKVIEIKEDKKPEETTDPLPETTKKLPIIKHNGMVGDLIEALSWAINSIKNKPEVKEKREWSSYYRKHERWCRHRDYFQKLEEEKR